MSAQQHPKETLLNQFIKLDFQWT